MPSATIPAAIKEIVLGSGTDTVIGFTAWAKTGAAATSMAMESRLRFISLRDLYVSAAESM